jgi:hypothetical protein
MWDEMKSIGLRRKKTSFIRRHTMKGNRIKGKTPQKRKA